MSITVNSLRDHRILHILFTDSWGLADLRSMTATIRTYLDQVEDKTHCIVDLSRPRSIPPGILLQFRDSLLVDHPKSGEFAVVFGTPAVRTFAELAFRLAHFTRVRFFGTEDAAWAYIRSIVASEDNLALSNSAQ